MSDRLTTAVSELVEALRQELRTEAAGDPRAPDRLYSISDAVAMTSLGRSRIYEEIASGHLRTIKSGRRRLISASALSEFIEGASASR